MRVTVVARRLLLWAPPLAYMALIFYLSSLSDPLPQLTSTVWDKAIHFVEYGALGFMLCRAFAGEGAAPAAAAMCALILTSAYGASDEWHQLFTPGRSSDFFDWFTDTIGGSAGAAGYLLAAAAISMVLRPPRPPRR